MVAIPPEHPTDYLYRFFAGLRVSYGFPTKSEAKLWLPPSVRPSIKTFWASGFIVQARKKYWFWVTAGHVWESLRQLRTDESKLQVDLVSPSRSVKREISLPIFDWPAYWVHRDDLGLDVAAVRLHRHFIPSVLDAGVRHFRPSVFARRRQQFQKYVLLGFPDVGQKNVPKHFRSDGIIAPVVLLQPTTPPDVLVKCEHRYYFEVKENRTQFGSESIVVDRVEGMSGGPVIGLVDEGGGTRMRLIGLQSGQGDISNVLTVCSIRKFVQYVCARIETEQ